jgi:hypothetical protein
VDILIIKDDFKSLMDVIIANLTRTEMVQKTLMMITHVVMMAIREKPRSYNERALGDDFIPLIIETHECFHFRFDSFFIACA